MVGTRRLFPDVKRETLDAKKVILEYNEARDGEVEATLRVVVRKNSRRDAS